MPIFGNEKRLETLAGPQCREYLAIFDDNLADSFSGMVKKSSFTTEQDSYIWSEVNYIPFNAIWEVSMALSLFFSIITQFAMALLIVMMPLIDGSPIEKYLPWPVVLAPLVTAMLSPFKKTSITIFITFISIRISDYNFSKPVDIDFNCDAALAWEHVFRLPIPVSTERCIPLTSRAPPGLAKRWAFMIRAAIPGRAPTFLA